MKKIIVLLFILSLTQAWAEVSSLHRTLLNPVIAEIYGPCMTDLEKTLSSWKEKDFDLIPYAYKGNIEKLMKTPLIGQECALDTKQSWAEGSARMKQVCYVGYWNAMSQEKLNLIYYFNAQFNIGKPGSCMKAVDVNNAWNAAYAKAVEKTKNVPPRDTCIYYGTPKLFEKSAAEMVDETECNLKSGCEKSRIQICQGAIRCYQGNKFYNETAMITGSNSTLFSEKVGNASLMSRYFQGVTCRAMKNTCPKAQDCLDSKRLKFVPETKDESPVKRSPGFESATGA